MHEQVILDDCGHVPQVELPERTNGLIAERIASATPTTPAAARRRLPRLRRAG